MRVLGIYLSILGVVYLVSLWVVMKPALLPGSPYTWTAFNYVAIAYYLAPGIAGLNLFFLAPLLCRLLLPEALSKLPLEPDSRIRNERFLLLLVGCLLTAAALIWTVDLSTSVNGRMNWSTDLNSWAPIVANGITGLLLLLKPRAMHQWLVGHSKG